jgi:hypothetical protein
MKYTGAHENDSTGQLHIVQNLGCEAGVYSPARHPDKLRALRGLELDDALVAGEQSLHRVGQNCGPS